MTEPLEGGSGSMRAAPGGHLTAEPPADRPRRGDRAIELRVGARLENLAVLRTLVGAVGTFEDLDLDAVADLRLAVDEVCTRLIRSAVPDATLVVVVDPRDDELVVDVSAKCRTYDVLAPGSLSWHVLRSLAHGVHTFHDDRGPDEGGGVFGISLTTRRAGPGRSR